MLRNEAGNWRPPKDSIKMALDCLSEMEASFEFGVLLVVQSMIISNPATPYSLDLVWNSRNAQLALWAISAFVRHNRLPPTAGRPNGTK